MEDSQLLSAACVIARQAGREILAVYHRHGEIQAEKKSDESPLTEADLRAHLLIGKALSELDPDIPVLSEESEAAAWEQRRRWQQYWLVDPLDGTREFISRNGEFTVNIALVRDGQPVLGVVHVPVQDVSYFGQTVASPSAFRQRGDDTPVAIAATRLQVDMGAADLALRVVASRRHGSDALQGLLARLQERFSRVELVSMGSSLKICLLAEGQADFYPRLAPTSEWDTAAAQAILCAAGGQIYDTNLNVLSYNRKDSLLNPSFLAVADRDAAWMQLLGEPEFQRLFCGEET